MFVGPPGIEPGLHPPHGCVLPVYYGPFVSMRSLVGPPGIEPGLYAPDAHVLPVYYGPTKNLITRHKNLGARCRIRTYDLSNVNRTL